MTMLGALNQFRDNLRLTRELFAAYDLIIKTAGLHEQAKDILRAQLVMAVSALDTLIHTIVRIGIIESFVGSRKPAKGFSNIKVSLQGSINAVATAPNIAWLDDEIRYQHSFLSFQQPDKISDALRYISDVKIWDIAETKLGRPKDDIVKGLELIVRRRNQIAHEADIDPTSPKKRYDITRAQVEDSIAMIERLGVALCEAVA